MAKLIILIVILLFVLLIWVLVQGVQQSKKTTGKIGRKMMNLWEKIYTPLFREVISNINFEGTKNILDIGIGSGISTKLLCQKNKKSKTYGVDYSEAAIERAKINNAELIKTYAMMLLQADVMALPFDDSFFP